MKSLTKSDYCAYYASKCKVCNGEKFVEVKGIPTQCLCQHSAELKFKFEQFEVDPPDLKYKSWDDFNGFLDGRQVISTESWLSAKQKAIQYCFGSSDPNVIKDRKANLVVQNHRHDGQNVIIVGNKGSGRTLIAALIIKEVAHACRIHDLDLSFKCLKAYDLFVAARWDNERSVDYSLLEELDVDFLVIDEVELMPPKGHHTNPPDYNTMNSLFGNRVRYKMPTIVICSQSFWSQVSHPKFTEDISTQWGKPFVAIMNNPQNVVIKIDKKEQSNG